MYKISYIIKVLVIIFFAYNMKRFLILPRIPEKRSEPEEKIREKERKKKSKQTCRDFGNQIMCTT